MRNPKRKKKKTEFKKKRVKDRRQQTVKIYVKKTIK